MNLARSFCTSVGQPLEEFQVGDVYVVVGDLSDYSETISKDALMLLIKEYIPDARMLKVIMMFRRSIPVSTFRYPSWAGLDVYAGRESGRN